MYRHDDNCLKLVHEAAGKQFPGRGEHFAELQKNTDTEIIAALYHVWTMRSLKIVR
jgi:hypothetical protein